MYIEKFGSEDKVNQVFARVNEAGKRGGINFSLDGNTGNTFQSHRLVEWSKEVGGLEAQDKVIELLFKGYFEEAQDITDMGFLVQVAQNAGLDKNAAMNLL